MYRASQQTRTYFVTFVCANRRRIFQVHHNAELFLSVLQTNRAKGRMQIHAFVLMPDHIHLLLTPAWDVSLEKAVQFLKGGFSFLLRSKADVWQRGSNETRMVDAAAFHACTHYIHQNPVRARLSEQPKPSRSHLPHRPSTQTQPLNGSGKPLSHKPPACQA